MKGRKEEAGYVKRENNNSNGWLWHMVDTKVKDKPKE
jgi:hypothetical protein